MLAVMKSRIMAVVIVLRWWVDNVRSLRVVAVMKSRMMAVVVGNVRNLRVVAVMKSQMGAMVKVSDVGCDEISDDSSGDSVGGGG